MLSVENKIINKVKKCGIGTVFFTDDFASFGKSTAVNKSLERLVHSELLIRIAKGNELGLFDRCHAPIAAPKTGCYIIV